ncbi:unnamed protein product [Leptosia nina]|uniref:Chitin-binding type-2 domain-containing protein n=1 Tax=Leptosia nina TaxID=320188 RepID=A0AAV1JCH2_9NEOP
MNYTKLQIILLVLLRDVITNDLNDTASIDTYRKERVSGRIVKLNSNDKLISHLCHKEGFLPDQNDCSIFYRCLKTYGDKYTVFRCAPGTIFDPDKEICNYPRNTMRSDCGVPPSFNDQRYENLVADLHQELPKPIKYREPQDYINSNKPLDNYNNILNDDLHTTDKKTATSFTTVAVPNDTELFTRNPIINKHNTQDNLCIKEGFLGDSNDCKKFYRCVNNLRGSFIRYEFMCNDATIWDDSIQGCNHAWIARNWRCRRDNTNYIDNTDADYGNRYDTGSSNKYPQENSHNMDDGYRPLQTNPPKDVQTKVDSIETTTYRFLGEQVQLSTKSTSSPLQYGDKIWSNSYTTPRQTVSKGNSYNQFGNTKNKEETRVTNAYIESHKNNNCHKNGFFGYSNDCKKFYRCVENTRGNFLKYEFSCSDGTLWDSKLQACNFAWAVKDCGATFNIDDNLITTTQTNNDHYSQQPLSSFSTQSDEDLGYGVHEESTTNNHAVSNVTTISDLGFSTPEGVKGECSANGFYGDQNNCQNFYRCIETRRGVFTKFAYKCGEGTLWDANIEACNHAWAVKGCTISEVNDTKLTTQAVNAPVISTISLLQTTTQANDIIEQDYDSGYHQGPVQFIGSTPKDTNNLSSTKCSKSGFMGDTNDCKKFYRCVDSGNGKFIRYEFSCGEGTVWDSRIESCNHAWAVEACNSDNNLNNDKTDSLLKPTDESNNSGYVNEVQNGNSKETTITNLPENLAPSAESLTTSTSTSKPTETRPSSDNMCKEEGFFGNGRDCTKFYRCVDNGRAGFELYEFSCGEGTIWDQDITACNHPQDVKRPSCSTSSNESSFTQSTISSTSSSVTTIKEDNTIVISSTEQFQGEQTTISSSTTVRETNENSGKNTCNEEGYFGDTDDCKNFYRCVSNGNGGYVKYDFTCGEGTVWDQEITACNHPRDVEYLSCSTESAKNDSTTMTTGISEFTTNRITSTAASLTSTTPAQSTTTEFSTLSTENNVKEKTTTEKALSSSTSATSTSSQNPPSDNTKPSKNSCSDEGFYGNTNDCKSFYRCVSNGKNGFTKYDFTCGEGTIWDQDILACNHPQDVEHPSCETSNVDISTTTEKIINNTEIETTSQSQPASTTTSSDNDVSTQSNEDQQSTEKQNEGNFTCTSAGFYPNPNDCKKFYRCVDWNNDGTRFSIFHFECGEGTIWDPSLDTCNYEDSVYPPRNCSGSSSQAQNNTDTTTSESSSTETTTQTTTTKTASDTTTQQSSSTASTASTEQETSTTDKTTTESQTTTTEKTTTQTESSSTDQTSTTTTSTSDTTTTTERSTTTTDQTTQTDKTTDASTSEGTTTQSSTTEQSTSTMDSSTDSSENDKTTTEAMQQTTETTTTSSTPKDKCPEMDDDQNAYVCPTSFRRHPKYCNIFYQCTEDDDNHDLKIALFHCPNNTIYDESKTQCVEESKSSKKCDGSLARSHRIKRFSGDYVEPLIVDTRSYACPNVGYFPFERNQECSPAILKCQRSKNNTIKGYVYKCPEGYIFWTKSKRCERMARLKDCKRSLYPWGRRHEIPKEIRNVAL